MKYKKNFIHSLFWFVIMFSFERDLTVALVCTMVIFILCSLVDVLFILIKHFIEYYGLESKLTKEMFKDY